MHLDVCFGLYINFEVGALVNKGSEEVFECHDIREKRPWGRWTALEIHAATGHRDPQYVNLSNIYIIQHPIARLEHRGSPFKACLLLNEKFMIRHNSA